jgi:hypothetical protein
MRYHEVARKLRLWAAKSCPDTVAVRIANGTTQAQVGSHRHQTGGKDLKMGTIRRIARQLGLDWEDLKYI